MGCSSIGVYEKSLNDTFCAPELDSITGLFSTAIQIQMLYANLKMKGNTKVTMIVHRKYTGR